MAGLLLDATSIPLLLLVCVNTVCHDRCAILRYQIYRYLELEYDQECFCGTILLQTAYYDLQ